MAPSPDPGRVTQSGTGTTILTGQNTYTGGTTISGGALQIGNGGTAGSITGNIVDNARLVVNLSNTSLLNGSITGSGSVIQSGPGRTILAGQNTYSGGTTISGGVLQIGNGGAGGSITGNIVDNASLVVNLSKTFLLDGSISGSGSVTQSGPGTTILTGQNSYSGGTTIGGGALRIGNGGTSGTLQGDVTNNGHALHFSRSDAYAFSGQITGTGAVIKESTGTLTLMGENTYTGGTTISGGALQIGNGGAAGSITGNIVNNASLAVNLSNTLVLNGSITGSGSVTQSGTGTTILTGDSTYTGGTTISAGALQLGNAGTAAGSIAGNITDNASLIFAHPNPFTYGGVITGSGSVTQSGTGTTILTGDSTYTGGTTILAGALQLGNAGTPTGSIAGNITNNSSLIFAHSNPFTYGGVITGAGSVTQSGTGTTVLTGDSSYGGGTTINAGAIQLGNGGATGSINGSVTDRGALLFDHSNTYVFSGQIAGIGVIAQIGAGTTILTGQNTYSGGTTISGGALQLGNGGAMGSITGSVQDNGAFIFDRSDTFAFAGLIQGSGSVSQIGAGAAILSNFNLYSGGTSLLGGSLGVGADGALGTGTLTVGPGNHGLFAAGRDVSENNPITLNGTLVVIDDPAGAHNLTLTGTISGAGGLTKLGRAVLTLTGTSRYQGATIVQAGSLVVDGAVATPSTLVEPGALLGGTGRLIGNLFNARRGEPRPFSRHLLGAGQLSAKRRRRPAHRDCRSGPRPARPVAGDRPRLARRFAPAHPAERFRARPGGPRHLSHRWGRRGRQVLGGERSLCAGLTDRRPRGVRAHPGLGGGRAGAIFKPAGEDAEPAGSRARPG